MVVLVNAMHPAMSVEMLCDSQMWLHLLQDTKKRKEKTSPFGVNLMRSQVLYRAAQGSKTLTIYSPGPRCKGMLHQWSQRPCLQWNHILSSLDSSIKALLHQADLQVKQYLCLTLPCLVTVYGKMHSSCHALKIGRIPQRKSLSCRTSLKLKPRQVMTRMYRNTLLMSKSMMCCLGHAAKTRQHCAGC